MERSVKLLLFFLFFTVSNLIHSQTVPGGINSNLQLWLKADAGTNSVVEGANINGWNDQSTQGRNAYDNAPTKNIPTYLNNAINFNPSINFTGTEALHSDATGLPTGGEARSVFIVAQSLNNFGWRYAFGSGYFHGNGSAFDIGKANNSTQAIVTAHSLPWVFSPNTWENDVAGIACGSLNSNSIIEFSSNGSPSILGNAPVNMINAPEITIGCNTKYGGSGNAYREHWIGTISEVVYFAENITGIDKRKVESYLAIKYGITLVNTTGGEFGDYVASDGTLLWDASELINYHNDVAGIGRDDASALGQVKSKSENSDAIVIIDAKNEGTNSSNTFQNFEDKEFLIWGNDNGPANWTKTNAPEYYKILTRTWKVQEEGEVGDVVFMLNAENPIFNVPSTIFGYYLIIDENNNNDLSDEVGYLLNDDGLNGDNLANDNIFSVEGININDGQIFTFATKIYAPGGVADSLELWLMADRGVYEGLASNEDEADHNDAIYEWVDYSNNNLNAIQNNGAVAFKFNELEEINYNPYLQWDAVGDQLLGGNLNMNGDNTHTSFFTLKEIAPTTDYLNVFNYDGVSANMRLETAAGDSWGFYDNTFEGNFNLTTTNTYNSTIDWQIASMLADGLNYKAFGNAKLGDTKDVNLGMSANGGVYSIGLPNQGANFDLSEIVIYSTNLSPENKNKVDSYLAVKYGITLFSDNTPNSNYTSSFGNVIWNAVEHSDYHNDIAGIGRDDVSLLGQVKSKSQNADGILTIYAEGEGTNKQNAFIDIDNNEWLLVGNNDGTADFSHNYAPIDYQILNRWWKVHETGETGPVTLMFNAENANFNIPQANKYYLIIDENKDSSFCNDAPIVALYDDGTHGDETAGDNIFSISEVNLSHSNLFTIAIEEIRETKFPIEITNLTCFENQTGSIVIDTVNSLAPLQYSIDGGISFINSNTFENLPSDSFTCVIKNAFGCELDTPVFINQPNPILSNISAELHVTCFNLDDGAAAVNPSGGTPPFSYEWNNGTQENSISQLQAGIYSVEITDANNCLINDTIEIYEPDSVLAEIYKTDASGCSDESVLLAKARGGNEPYNYTWNNGSNDSTINIHRAGTYAVIIRDTNNCEAKDSVFHYVFDSVKASIKKVQDISCFGINDGEIEIEVTGGETPYSYEWNGIPSDSIRNELTKGVYKINITDNRGCKDSLEVQLIEPEPILLEIENTSHAICTGTTLNLVVNTNGGTPEYEYFWNGTPSNIPIFSQHFNSSQIVQVYVSDGNECTSETKEIDVTVYNPEGKLNTNKSAICLGDCIELTFENQVQLPIPFTIEWDNGHNSSVFVDCPKQDKSYTVEINYESCATPLILNQEIKVHNLPVAAFENKSIICENEEIEFLNLSRTSNNSTYLWNFGNNYFSAEINPFHTYTKPGSYNVSLELTNENGCSHDTTLVGAVLVIEAPHASFITSDTVVSEFESAIKFTNSSTSFENATWYIENDIFENENTLFYQFENTGNHEVKLVVHNNEICWDSAQQIINVVEESALYVPNAFSPDENNLNDEFSINGIGELQDYEFSVYNRWGERLFFSKNPSESWKGKDLYGNILPMDVYVWKVTGIDVLKNKYINLTGKVTLLK